MVQTIRILKPDKFDVLLPLIYVPLEVSEGALVGGKKVEFGSYIYATEDVTLTPTLLLLIFKLQRL